MKVIVSDRAVQAVLGTDHLWKLNQLITYACQGRHTVWFDPPTALDDCLNMFAHDVQPRFRSILESSIRQAVTLSSDCATIRIEPIADPIWDDPVAILPLDDALGVLDEPLGILVENSANDWHFLYGIMRQHERRYVLKSLDKGWAICLHGGGSTLIKQLEARLQSKKKALRTFVMFDSDRLHPDECDSNWTPERPNMRPAACQAYKWETVTKTHLPLRYWMLKRRFIESYMPQSELNKGASQTVNPDAFDAFNRLHDAGRWYFNMKNGFLGDDKRDDKERIRDLYENVAQVDVVALNQGFGDKLADHYSCAASSEFNWDDDAREEAGNAMPRLMRLF